jgi:hypothetical protein
MTLLEQLFKSARTREVATETAEGFVKAMLWRRGRDLNPRDPKGSQAICKTAPGMSFL